MTHVQDDIRFEHLAYHELGHLVVGEQDEREIERHVEYIVYTMVGLKKYRLFIYAMIKQDHPEWNDQRVNDYCSAWVALIGAVPE